MSAKYYKRGAREYYRVVGRKVWKVVNMENYSLVHVGDNTFWLADAMNEGTEITREEFKAQFEVASRLIVLEP